MSDAVNNLLSIAAMVIGVSAVLISRRNYLRTKAHLESLQARFPNLAKDAGK